MAVRVCLLALAALFACLTVAPAAGAQSGVDQYLEQVPDAEGKGPADDAGSGDGALPGDDKQGGENAAATAPPDDGDDGGVSGVVIAVIAVVLLGPIAFLLYRRFGAGGRSGEPGQA